MSDFSLDDLRITLANAIVTYGGTFINQDPFTGPCSLKDLFAAIDVADSLGGVGQEYEPPYTLTVEGWIESITKRASWSGCAGVLAYWQEWCANTMDDEMEEGFARTFYGEQHEMSGRILAAVGAVGGALA